MNPATLTPADRLFANGLARHQDGLLEQALALYEQALQHQPAHFDALHHIGIVAYQAANHAVALQFFDAALQVDRGVAALHSNLGNVLQALGRHADALASYDQALALDAAHRDAHFNRGNALQALGRWAAALHSYDQALALAPADPAALNNRATVLQELRQFDAALASCDAALARDPAYAEAWNNRGNLLARLRRHDQALASFAQALACRPGYADALVNQARALKELGQPGPALACLDQALAHAPDCAAAHWNRALLCLQQGRFDEGWRGYEWRWQAGHLSIARERRAFAQPLWLGQQPLAGRTLLLHAEQGLGDTLQMCRYAPLLAARGARVILEVQPALTALLATLAGPAAVVARGDPLPPFDFHCPLMSLPLACATTLDTIPAATPYLAPDPARVAAWQERLGPRRRPRVGLAWSGNPGHQHDHQRSIRFAALAPLLQADCQFVSLQQELHAGEQALLAAAPRLRHCGGALHDFADTAALCALMDVVIAVDTSVAHLAGALARPLWLLLPADPDWRWLLGRADSPWYPGARLFRQQRGGDWDGALAEVAAALAMLPD